MSSDSIISMAYRIISLVGNKKWFEAIGLTEVLLGALKVKSCLDD